MFSCHGPGQNWKRVRSLLLLMLRRQGKPANIFFYKPVVCQARDKVLPDIQSVWSDKNIFPHLLKKKERMTGFSVIKLF